jgi:hypothetical protein
MVRLSTPPPTTLQPPRPQPTAPQTPDTLRSLQITINRFTALLLSSLIGREILY